MEQRFRLILASASPRRRELLQRMGYEFEICAPDVDEHVDGRAEDIVQTLAARKARAAAAHYAEGVIIASDTLVSLEGKPLGKPVDEDEAYAMLRALSDAEIWDYIHTGEPIDKAGAYGIQGGAGAFVEELDGSFENVMGFPVEDVERMLRGFAGGGQ